MAKTVRLDDDVYENAVLAAAEIGEPSATRFINAAVAARADEILHPQPERAPDPPPAPRRRKPEPAARTSAPDAPTPTRSTCSDGAPHPVNRLIGSFCPVCGCNTR